MSSHRNTQEFIARAEQILTGFEYTCLARGVGVEVWDCRRPGTSVYAFTISVAPRGIAVVGDIGALTFGVGSAFGLPFLAGDDVAYYIHSKLSHEVRDGSVELDTEAFRRAVAGLAARFLEGVAAERQYVAALVATVKRHECLADAHDSAQDSADEAGNEVCDGNDEEDDAAPVLAIGEVRLPVWIGDLDEAMGHFDDLLALARTHAFTADSLTDGDMWDRLGAYLDRCARVTSLDEAYRVLDEARTVLKACDASEFSVRRVAGSLIQNLFLVNVAARRILVWKETGSLDAQEAR